MISSEKKRWTYTLSSLLFVNLLVIYEICIVIVLVENQTMVCFGLI